MIGKFDSDKEYGETFAVSSPEDWTTIAIIMARRFVPQGYTVLCANNGIETAWRYPSKPELVPENWKFVEIEI